MVPLLNSHFSWGVVRLPVETYLQLISEGSHVRPIRRPLIVSEISYVGGSGFVGARNCCACPLFYVFFVLCPLFYYYGSLRGAPERFFKCAISVAG